MHDLRGLLQQPRLRVRRMDDEVLCHELTGSLMRCIRRRVWFVHLFAPHRGHPLPTASEAANGNKCGHWAGEINLRSAKWANGRRGLH
jgi:hypothetical protein